MVREGQFSNDAEGNNVFALLTRANEASEETPMPILAALFADIEQEFNKENTSPGHRIRLKEASKRVLKIMNKITGTEDKE